MKNIGIQHVLTDTSENFATDIGIKVRRFINAPLRLILKIATKKNITIESRSKLEKKEPCIYISTHSYDEDIISSLASLDRHAYILIGSTDQINYNRQLYAAWVNGLIYVNRKDEKSRKETLLKLEKVLKSGSSVLIFIEGTLNNSENRLIQGEGMLFSSPYVLAQKTGAKVVPIGNFNDHGEKEIYINFEKPIDMKNKDKKEALLELRDVLATMTYNAIEKHAKPLVRSELPSDYRKKYLEQRKSEYLSVKWHNPCWEEELDYYKDKNIPAPQDVWASFEKVKVTPENEAVIRPLLALNEEYKERDFKIYMKNNWNKR